jgi:O-acetyl-ADP-ribose deacetylase (regulator of RNase III)
MAVKRLSSPADDERTIAVTTYRGTRIQVLRGDITTTVADHIVTPTNEEMRGEGGEIDESIHEAAGFALLEELEKARPRGGDMGEAYLTHQHYMDHARRIIHAVVPNYAETDATEERTEAAVQLREAYLNALRLSARQERGNTIAFPTMGVDNEFPPDRGAEIALNAIRDFIHEMGGRRNFGSITIIVGGPRRNASERAYQVHM